MPQLVLNMVESKKGPDTLTLLTPQQTKAVVEGLKSKDATFFNYQQFKKLTKGLPPSIHIADILKFLRGSKK